LTGTDICLYSLGFALQKKDPETGEPDIEQDINKVYSLVDHHLNNIFKATKATCFTVYLTGKGNFREKLYKEYKANRKDAVKPFHYNAIREYLIDKWKAVVINGMEADDALSIAQCKAEEGTTIIHSADKDLNMVPGLHHSDKLGIYEIDEITGLRNFYSQLITGDKVDNIPGLSEIAPKKRTYKTSPLDDMDDEIDMIDYVIKGYQEKYGERDWSEHFDLNSRLLWMLREPLDK